MLVANLGPATAAPGGETFCNPLNLDYRFSIAKRSYREAADPDVIVFNHEYYLFASHSGGYWWSPDFKDWHLVIPQGINIEKFAPSVIVIDHTMYYTSSETGHIYKTTDPKGGVWTYVSHPHNWSDPAMFVDDDGSVYCYYGCSAGGAIKVVKLDPKNNFSVIGSEIPCFSANPKDHGFEVSGDDNTSYKHVTWIEGSWMTKYKGTYYLQYAVPGTNNRSYCDGVYQSSSPTGPFVFCPSSPVVLKPTGFVTGVGHGCVFQDLKGKYWKLDTVTISVNHMFERRLAVFPLEFDADGLMHSNTVLGDYPQYLPGQAVNSIDHNLVGWNLVSYGKTATASSQAKAFAPTNAFDEDIRTWWCAATGNSGEWLRVDLGKSCTLNAVQVNFAEQDATYFSGRTKSFSYKYKVDYSTDGTAWNVLVDKSENTNDFPHDYTELPSAKVARYVRITNLGPVPGDGKFAISDLRIFGNGGGNAPDAPTGLTAIRSVARTVTVKWHAAAGAQAYIVRYGTATDKLYNHYEAFSGTSATINALNAGQDYFFAVDAINDSGITRGQTTTSALSPK